VTGEPVPTVAILTAPGGVDADGPLLAGLAEVLTGHGLRVLVAEPEAVRYERDRPMISACPVHVVLRYFNLDDVAGEPPPKWAERLFHAQEEGHVFVWTGLDSAAYSHKMTLAFLSDPAWSGALSAEQRSLLDRVLPWTRVLAGTRTTVNGDTVDLIEYSRAERENLLLKPLRGWGGAGLVMGWEQTDRQWHRALEDSLDAGFLVQRRVRPRHEMVVDPVSGKLEPWIATWGMFVTPVGYAGTDVRALPADAGSIVNFGTNERTKTTGVFSYPDSPAATPVKAPGDGY
jgi:hypothetical protein